MFNFGLRFQQLLTLPRQDLIAYFKDGVDTIGESSLENITGSGATLDGYSWSFPASAVMLAIDTALGGDVLFDSTNSMAPFVKSYKEWVVVLATGQSIIFVGLKGIAAYQSPQTIINVNKILRYLDGVKLPDLWALSGMSVKYSPAEDIYYWGGSNRTIDDLSVAGGQGRYIDDDIGFTGFTTVVLEVELEQATPPAGLFLTIAGVWPSSAVRLNWETYNSGLDYWMRGYVNPPGAYVIEPNTTKGEDATGAYTGKGIRRLICKLNNGELYRVQLENGDYRPSASMVTMGAVATPTRVGFACNAWITGTPNAELTGATLHKVAIFNEDVSDDTIAAIGRAGVRYPLHIIGDSFCNAYKFNNALMLETKPLGYVGFSHDGVGSSTITEQAIRFSSSNPKWYHSTLLIYEGGLDGDGETAIAAITDMVSRLTHDRWAMISPAPSASQPIGSQERITWDANIAIIKAFCGDRFIDTLDLIQAAGDGSSEDNAEVAKGLWPLSMKGSASDFHPNANGDAFIANIVFENLKAKGWL